MHDTGKTSLLYGAGGRRGLVAAEHASRPREEDRMVLFQREDGGIAVREVAFRPYLWLADAGLISGLGPLEVRELRGDGAFRYLLFFRSWADLEAALRFLRKATGLAPTARDAPYFVLRDPVQQYLTSSGETFFKEMEFGSVHRLQVDIETRTEPGYEFPNPEREGDRILLIALSDNRGWSEVLGGPGISEKRLLESFVQRVRERDPDVIEGYNLFKFDLPYLITRARREGVKLAIGRDGSEMRTRPGRFMAAERTINYTKTEIFGRQVVDVYFLVHLYDVTRRELESWGLKEAARHFGVAVADRVRIEGGRISETFRVDPSRVRRYALHDVLETRRLAELLSPAYFAMAQMVPMNYQNVCVRGNAAKIDALMIREYLRQGFSLPRPDEPRRFAGGYTDIFFQGVARNVHHCDVRSLYPSIMLLQKIRPHSDELGIFLQLLGRLRDQRMEIRRVLGSVTDETRKRALLARDAAFKVLINSFYGYLGFAQARFNDYAAAEKVAARGRELLRDIVDWLTRNGALVIEIDTDGVYFVPPRLTGVQDLERFRRSLRESLPAGIELEFDGVYRAMYSYRMKNYALLGEDGSLVIRGAALRSRGLEPFQRRFLEDFLRLRLEGREAEIPALKECYVKAITRREWPVEMFTKTETLQENPSEYVRKVREGRRGRSAAYELALSSGREYRAGDQISYYITGSTARVSAHTVAKLAAEWDAGARDENVAHYLAKLEELCEKFGVNEIIRRQKGETRNER